jgi:hypothetical protein
LCNSVMWVQVIEFDSSFIRYLYIFFIHFICVHTYIS